MTARSQSEPGAGPLPAASSAPRPVQNLAIAANSGIVLLSIATGGLGADLLQLYAAQVLGLSPRQVGFALGLLVVSIPAQLLAASRARRYTPRRVMRWGYCAILGCLLAFPWVQPLLAASRTAGFALFVAVVLAVEIAMSCSWAIVWWAWMQDLVRPPHRGRFLGHMRFTTQTVSALALLSISLLFHSRVSYAGYNVLLTALVCYVLLALWLFGRIPDRRPTAPSQDGGPSQFSADLRALARNRPARTMLGVLLLTQLLAAPLLSTYLLDVIRLSPGTISRLLAIRTIVGVVALRGCGPAIDRYGAKRVQLWTAAGAGASSLLWLAVRVSSAHRVTNNLLGWPLVLLISVLSAAAMSGFGLAYLADLQDTIPPSIATTAFALQDIISSSVAQLAFLLAGLLIAAGGCGARAVSCAPALLDPYRALLVAGLPAALGIVALLRRAMHRINLADPDQAFAHRED